MLGRREIAKLKYGTDTDAGDYLGRTPLHSALQ